MHSAGYDYVAFIVFGIAIFVTAITSSAIRVADQWSKAVVLRLGKFRALQGPGLFFIIPLIDTIPYWIDTRVLTSSFKAEKTLTKDTVPVDVDAVLFWKIVDTGHDIVGSLMRAIKRENTNMVVISTHGVSGWRPLMFGSIAEQVIKQVSCTLLLLQSVQYQVAVEEPAAEVWKNSLFPPFVETVQVGSTVADQLGMQIIDHVDYESTRTKLTSFDLRTSNAA